MITTIIASSSMGNNELHLTVHARLSDALYQPDDRLATVSLATRRCPCVPVPLACPCGIRPQHPKRSPFTNHYHHYGVGASVELRSVYPLDDPGIRTSPLSSRERRVWFLSSAFLQCQHTNCQKVFVLATFASPFVMRTLYLANTA